MDSIEAHLRGVMAGAADATSLEGRLDDLDAAYDLRDAVADGLGPVCGWKIALNGPGQVEQLGLPGPIVSRIVGEQPMASGVTLRRSAYRGLALEPELAVVMGREVTAPLERTDMPGVVDRIHVAFEVLDRCGLGAVLHPPTFVANNIFNAGVVLGDSISSDSLDGARGRFVFDGEEQFDRSDSAPQHPYDAALHVINHVVGRDLPVARGAVILCGTHHPPLPVQVDAAAMFRVGDSEVSLSISP